MGSTSPVRTGEDSSARVIATFKDNDDGFDDAINVLEDVVIPETNYAETVVSEVRGADAIGLRVMLAAISLDDQLSFEADEVGDEGTDAVLEAELPAEPPPAQA